MRSQSWKETICVGKGVTLARFQDRGLYRFEPAFFLLAEQIPALRVNLCEFGLKSLNLTRL
jgi:hypothetical protein